VPVSAAFTRLSVISPKSADSGRCTITTAPFSDWLNSSQSTVAGEKP
jgi:hypothetical protein